MRSRAASRNALAPTPRADHLAAVDIPPDIEWRVSEAPVPYEEALVVMEQRAAAIREGSASECIWLLEHPPLFTAGTSADPAELTNAIDLPVYEAGRGGRPGRPFERQGRSGGPLLPADPAGGADLRS